MIHDLLVIALSFLAVELCGVVVGEVIANADEPPTPRLSHALAGPVKENKAPSIN